MHGSRVRFQLLGPVSLSVGGAVVPLGGPVPRGLLALLLLADGATVHADRAVDALWGAQPPRTSTGRVHVVMSELRRALAPIGDGTELIRTVPGGYRMPVPAAPGSLDLTAFSAEAAAGRRAVAAGRHAEAAAHCRAALAAWSGAPLDGLTAPFAAAEAERLDSRRVETVEALAAATLAEPGTPDTAFVDELAALQSARPEREALLVLTMAALGRAGRRVEALEICRRNRRWLRDELGMAHSRRVRELETAILRDGAPPRLFSTIAARRDDRQLPRPVPEVTGRTDEPAWLDRHLPTDAATDLTHLPLHLV